MWGEKLPAVVERAYNNGALGGEPLDGQSSGLAKCWKPARNEVSVSRLRKSERVVQMTAVPEDDNHYEIMLRDEQGALLPATVELVDIDAYECQLTLRWAGGELQSIEGDYFEAFCRIRERLEEQGLLPMCYGASRRIVISGMGRDMAAGLRVYKVKLGKQAQINDLVDLFATDDDVEPVSVVEQQAFQEQWYASLR